LPLYVHFFLTYQKHNFMEATCKNCSHWDTQAPVVQEKSDMGECNKLSQPENKQMAYILPVLQTGSASGVEFITGADFGCNQFAQA
jgi:hypothetical protein